jgi:hypothetical protein
MVENIVGTAVKFFIYTTQGPLLLEENLTLFISGASH